MNRRFAKRLLNLLPWVAWCASGLSPAAPARAAEPPVLVVTAGMGGAFDAVGFDEGGIEVQLQPQFRGVQATLGVLTNENDTVFSYLGLRRAFEIEPFYFALFTGMGRYWRADGRELGGDLQFRSGLEAGYRTNGGWRVGIVLYHLSNGGIEHRNPGTETVAVTWGVPLSLHRSFGRH